MSSNSPSGGMKEMVRSFSKRDSRTHWWNFTSSSSTDLLFPPEQNKEKEKKKKTGKPETKIIFSQKRTSTQNVLYGVIKTLNATDYCEAKHL